LGNNYESILILNYATNYNNLRQLFEEYEESLSIVVTIESLGWTFGEIVCSAFTSKFNNKELSIFEWDIVWSLLLFSENLEVSDTFYSFLQKNLVLENFSPEIYISSAFFLLDNPLIDDVRGKYLQIFLNSLKLETAIKNDILFECLKTNTYDPLVKHLGNIIKF